MKAVKRPIVVLNLPTAVPAFIVRVRHVILVMTSNKWLPNLPVPMATVTADVDKLAASEALTRKGTYGAAATRDLDRKTVENHCVLLKGYVQSIVNANVESANAIASSAGMSIKQSTTPQKPELQALMGPTPDEVILRAKAPPKRAAYEWQYSADGGMTWITIGTTTVAETRVSGLTAGATYLFRFRTTHKKTTGAWSQTISFIVH